jgi:hypothetical protein
MIVELACSGDKVDAKWDFHQLPARPLVRHDLALDGLNAIQVEATIRAFVAQAAPDAVISVRVSGTMTEAVSRVLSARNLRDLAPATMNLDLSVADRNRSPTRPRSRRQPDDVLELPL